MKDPEKTRPRKKTSRRVRPEKAHLIPREAERSVKTSSLARFIDQASQTPAADADTLGQDQLVCPFCKYRHEAEDLKLGKATHGMVKCSDCGEGFEFETIKKVAYTTMVP